MYAYVIGAYVFIPVNDGVFRGVGVALAMPRLLAAATATRPPAQASTGGGIVTMARQVGLALGVSLLMTMVDGADPEPVAQPLTV